MTPSQLLPRQPFAFIDFSVDDIGALQHTTDRHLIDRWVDQPFPSNWAFSLIYCSQCSAVLQCPARPWGFVLLALCEAMTTTSRHLWQPIVSRIDPSAG